MTSAFERRRGISAVLAMGAGYFTVTHWPFPAQNVLLQLVALERPGLYHALHCAYVAICFTTPYLVLSVVSSLFYIFVIRQRPVAATAGLPLYPDPARRESLFVIAGEVHHPKRPEPVADPSWLRIPERGLYTGIMVIGAIGSGKTSGCMYPFAEQILGYQPSDPERRIGGLVLEVKGDFCHKVRGILKKHGRATDYVEVSLDTDYRYNPLYNDLDAYASAYGIASLLNNLFGKGKEPFWQQAYTNLVKFIILLHKVLDDYVTLFDVYQGAINPAYLEDRIKEGEQRFASEFLLIGMETFLAHRELEMFPFECDGALQRMKAPSTEDLIAFLDSHGIDYETQNETDPVQPGEHSHDHKRQQFEAVKRWFYYDWLRIEPKLRTSIVEGISVFLSLFDDNPAVKRVFCPPKAAYDPAANADGRYGKPLPSFSEMIEAGTVCALNFPVSANPGLAKMIGTLMKQDFQRAVLNRIPAMEKDLPAGQAAPQKVWRQVLFLCDEYHAFATVGENDPSGDEKFFALSRQAKCIALVATQSISSLRSTLPGESWRTLLQTFRTKIFLALSDDFSARTASELCGKEEQLKLNYSLSENGQDAGISMLDGRATAHKTSLTTSKGYNVQRDFVFEAKVFSELRNAQAIVLAYDGLNPAPPTYCYLKPYYLDPNRSYFDQLAGGLL
jgi:hypothetical protein